MEFSEIVNQLYREFPQYVFRRLVFCLIFIFVKNKYFIIYFLWYNIDIN
jgi:hypothetical protein